MRKCGEIPPHLFEGEGEIATRLPGAAKPNEAARIRRSLAQRQCKRPIVHPIGPIATTEEDATRIRTVISIKFPYSFT